MRNGTSLITSRTSQLGKAYREMKRSECPFFDIPREEGLGGLSILNMAQGRDTQSITSLRGARVGEEEENGHRYPKTLGYMVFERSDKLN